MYRNRHANFKNAKCWSLWRCQKFFYMNCIFTFKFTDLTGTVDIVSFVCVQRVLPILELSLTATSIATTLTRFHNFAWTPCNTNTSLKCGIPPRSVSALITLFDGDNKKKFKIPYKWHIQNMFLTQGLTPMSYPFRCTKEFQIKKCNSCCKAHVTSSQNERDVHNA